MRFGIVQEAYFPPGLTLQQRYLYMVEEAVQAERSGFDFYCTSEQHFGFSEAYILERADKQLEVLGQAGPQSELGVLLYRSALFAERQRQDVVHGLRGRHPEDRLVASEACCHVRVAPPPGL